MYRFLVMNLPVISIAGQQAAPLMKYAIRGSRS